MKKSILFVVLTLLTGVSVFAGASGIPLEILNKGVGVRALSMGGAYVADSSDATAFFWNAASLDNVTKNQAFASFETFYESANYENIAYINPIGRYGGLGIGIGNMIYGTYEIVGEDGETQGEGSVNDIVVTGSYGKSIIAGILAGASAKTIIRTIGDDAYPAFNMDLSLFKSFGENISLGLNFKNILPLALMYEENEEKFVLSMRGGISARLLDNALIINLDVEKYFIDVDPVINSGVEYTLFDMISLRAGVDSIADINNIGGGFGIRYNGFQLDYGVVLTEVNLSHKIALSYSFGGYELILKPEPEVFSPLGGNRKTYIRVLAETKYEIYKWKTFIKDSNGNIVKFWEGAGEPDGTLLWDGLDKDGMPNKEGEYTAQIVITDENDTVVRSKETKITISTTGEHTIPLFGE